MKNKEKPWKFWYNITQSYHPYYLLFSSSPKNLFTCVNTSKCQHPLVPLKHFLLSLSSFVIHILVIVGYVFLVTAKDRITFFFFPWLIFQWCLLLQLFFSPLYVPLLIFPPFPSPSPLFFPIFLKDSWKRLISDHHYPRLEKTAFLASKIRTMDSITIMCSHLQIHYSFILFNCFLKTATFFIY